MQYRTLGFSGLKISVIGLGTWAIGGGDWKFGWGDQDEQEAIDTIVRAVELGINWIDTAAIYGEGRSEVLVAKAMRQISTAAIRSSPPIRRPAFPSWSVWSVHSSCWSPSASS